APDSCSMPSTSRGANRAPMVLEPLICNCNGAVCAWRDRQASPAKTTIRMRACNPDAIFDISTPCNDRTVPSVRWDSAVTGHHGRFVGKPSSTPLSRGGVIVASDVRQFCEWLLG